jgi:NADPH:quinone reductase-like Zn-dependent oxidoreductase
MRAVVQQAYGGPDQLRLEDWPDPVAGKGEVLLRVLACRVNLSDWESLTGSPAYARISGPFRSGRRILGSDIVGEVLSGEGFRVEQRVMADAVMRRGGFAERVALPAALCAPEPEGLDDATAAALPQPGPIAVQGMRVLINGAGGGSGTLALQLAKATGAEVTVVDRGEKLGFLQAMGAEEAIDFHRQDFTAMGRVWDLILDMVATRNAGQIAQALAPGGTYRAVGGAVRVILPLALTGWMQRGRRIGVLAVKTGAAVTADVAARAIRGELRPVVADVLGLDRVAEALAAVGAGVARGKLVIRP